MPRIKKQTAELKNRIIDEILANYLPDIMTELEFGMDSDSGFDKTHIEEAGRVIEKALIRRRS